MNKNISQLLNKNDFYPLGCLENPNLRKALDLGLVLTLTQPSDSKCRELEVVEAWLDMPRDSFSTNEYGKIREAWAAYHLNLSPPRLMPIGITDPDPIAQNRLLIAFLTIRKIVSSSNTLEPPKCPPGQVLQAFENQITGPAANLYIEAVEENIGFDRAIKKEVLSKSLLEMLVDFSRMNKNELMIGSIAISGLVVFIAYLFNLS